MHALLGLSTLLLAVLAGYVILVGLRRLDGWSHRRDLQLVVLAAPVVSLGVGLGGLHHFTGRTCFLGAPSWDYMVGIGLPLAMGLVALGGLCLGAVRLVLMHAAGRCGKVAGPELREVADRLAERMGASRPRVVIRESDKPLALTYGIRHPTVVLSTWMTERLDRSELESVLAHELGHVVRSDPLVIWLATILRDGFFYLPTSRAAYRLLQHERELASDDLAVEATHRPLALASALAKVWHQVLEGPARAAAQALVATGQPIEERIERLLADPPSRGGQARRETHERRRGIALGVGAQAILGLLTLTAANVTVMLTPMGCGLGAVLGPI